MSIKIMTHVWEHSPSTGSKRLVLLALADNANDDGYCWPSLETIASKCRLTRRYTINLLDQLEADGEIRRRRRVKDGKYTSTMYQVIVNPGTPQTGPGSAVVVHSSTLPGESECTTIVNPSSPRSVPGFTTGSEAGLTGVVSPASLKPSFNRKVEPSIEPSAEAAPPKFAEADPAAAPAVSGNGKNGDPQRISANKTVLREIGVGLNRRSLALCELAHVTPAYLRAHAAQLHFEKRFSAALLITIVEAADPAPEMRANGHPVVCDCPECQRDYWRNFNQEYSGNPPDDEEIPEDATADSSIFRQVFQGSTKTPADLWERIVETLRLEMPKAAFDINIDPTFPWFYDPTAGRIQIAAPDDQVRAWLQDRLRATVERMAAGIANRQIEIEFIVPEETYV